MRAAVDAVRALVASGTSRTAYTVTVPHSPTYPYYIVSPSFAIPEDGALDGTRADLDLRIMVKAVALTADGALILADLARAVLFANWRPVQVTVTGYRAQVEWLRHEADYIDPDVFYPASNTNPAISVDTYRLQATPA